MNNTKGTIYIIFKIKLILLAFLFTTLSFGQVTIASDGLNNSSSLFTLSGGSYYSGNSAAGDSPSSSPFFLEGTHSRGVSNNTATLTSNSNINTSLYTSISLTLRLAAFSIGSASNGMDAGDIVTVEVSPDGGATWFNTLEVTGTSNARWSYSTGTGSALTSYDGDNTPDSFSPTSGGNRTTDGYSTIRITGLPATASLRFRITLLNDTNSERWVVDDFKVQGTVACVPPTIASVFPTSGPVGTTVTINASSGNLSGATATFNGLTATVISTSATQMVVVVPAGATSGNIVITNTANCPVSTPFTIIKEEKTSCEGASFASDLIIYEVHDEQKGTGGAIIIYNGTGVPKDLSNYTIFRSRNFQPPGAIEPYIDFAVTRGGLTGVLAPGALAVIKVNLLDCGMNTLNGLVDNGFNDGDGLQLRTKDGVTIIDDVLVDATAAGYYKKRISNPITPRSVYVATEWTEIKLVADECVPTLGTPPIVSPGSGNPPVITTQPVFVPSCTNVSFTVAGTEGFPGLNALAYRWYELAPNSTTWTPLTTGGIYTGATSVTLTISSVTGLDGYQYYAQVRENTATCYTASNAVMIKAGGSGGPVIATKTPVICSGTAFTVTPTNTLPDVVPTGTTYTWTAPVIAPAAAITGGSARTTPITSISQVLTNTTTAVATATYTVTANSGGCTSIFTITVTVNPLPTVTPNSRCGTGTVTLGATTTTGTILWFAADTGGTSLATGTSFTTPSIAATTSYWVEATSGSCTSTPRVEVIATITSSGSIPKPTVKTPVEYCLSTTTPASPLTATTTVPGATLNWYATPTSTPALASAPIPNITTVSSITYYVSQSLAGCEGPREAIVVNVIADTGVIATSFVCDPSQITTSPVSSVYFDWANVVGRTGYYKYSYSIDGSPLVFGFTQSGRSSQEVFGVAPGQKVEFTIVEVQGVPCFKPQTISCSLACTTTTVPDFSSIPATQSICTGSTAPVLPPNSNNGISGTWLPATVSNTTTGTYEFTPDAILFPCASNVSKQVVVTQPVTPTFAPIATSYCQNAIITLPILPTTSTNGIIGAWNPASISTSALGTIVHDFTPSTGSCAISTSISITVNANVAPTFNPVLPICSGATLSALPTTSLNGITGTWSPALNNTATTIYTFTPTAGLCATTTTLTIVVNPKVTPTFDAIPATCSGTTIPGLPTTSLNGVTGTWSPVINNTSTTIYTFTPTTGLCATTTPLTITIDSKVNPTFLPVAPICSGGILLPLPLTSTNGITGTWSPALNNLATTIYTFVPNTGFCATNQTLTITVNPILTPTFNAVPAICSGATLSALPNTSQNGITGTWSPALNNTATTIYTFTPTLGLCATNQTLSIAVNPNITPTFNTVPSTCSGTAISALSTTSLNGITGTWSPAINNTITTNYTFTPTAGLCATTAPLTITINPKTTPTFNAVPAACSGTTIPSLPTTSLNGITGTWSPAINNTITTNYTFTPTTGLCANTASLTITIDSKVIPSFLQVQPICLGASIPALPLTSTNGITGIWSPPLDNLATTTYTFTPSTGSCAGVTQMTITVNPIATPIFNTIGSICKGTNIILPTTSVNNITGVWSPPFNPLQTTPYSFTPDTGQCATPTNQTVTIIQLPVATNTTGPTSICSGDKTFINLESDIPGTTFTWNVVQTNATGATAGAGTRIEPNLEAVSNKSGEAVYSITPNNSGCKGASIEVTITVNPIPDVKDNTEKSTICSGTSTNISLTSGVVGTTYIWTVNATPNVFGALPGNGNLIQQELSTNDLTQGNVVYTITPDSNGCPGTAIDVTIIVDPLPDSTALAAKNPICSGETTKIDLSSTIGASFNWTVIQSGVTGATKDTGASIEQTLQAGTVAGTANYIITPILNGCEGTPNPVIINVNPLPVAVIQEDGLLCIRKDGTVKSSFILNTNLNDADYDFVWYKDNAVIPSPFPPLLPPTSSYEATEIGDYYVAITNKLTSCYAESNTALITKISPADYIDPPIVSDAFTDNATIIINVFPPADYYLYQMDFGPLQDFNEFTQVKGGSHIIRVTDAIGCTDLSTPARVISYPKFFTPNGDGYNDTWNIIDLGDQPNAKLYIFDRHGKLLKQISTDENGWDGTYNGKQLPASDYWFSINYFENDELKLFKAHFSLKR